jgi:hypothetical protein
VGADRSGTGKQIDNSRAAVGHDHHAEPVHSRTLRDSTRPVLKVPSGSARSAVSHRFTYSTTQGQSVLASTALTMRSCGTLS